MSTEIYCSRFLAGQPVAFTAGIVEHSFSGYIESKEEGALLLRFGDPEEPPTRLQFHGSTDDKRSFAVERPVEDLKLYQALLQVLQQEGYVAYVPGSPLVVACAHSPKHLPEDMVSSLGAAVEVASGQALRDALFSR